MSKEELATFGGGCFWCTEAIFQQLKGVLKVVSGYMGGTAPGKPTYREICSGLTGHAEVIQITFDANSISFEDLLQVFMDTHNPTELNRQGADIGTQYRSVVFYHSKEQQRVTQKVIQEIQNNYPMPIVTEISPNSIFYPAEEYHQDYYNNNKSQGYCQIIIKPKLDKLKEQHSSQLKSS